jgi:N-sulfoglucosamine sulfohydrolase
VAKAYTGNDNRTGALGGSPSLKELEDAPKTVRAHYQAWINPPKMQLYDLINDPHEFTDLASQPKYAAVKKRLLKALQNWQIETNDPLRFPEKLRMLTAEHDTIKVSKDMRWNYPKYLYGEN